MDKEFMQAMQDIKSAPAKLLTRELYPSGKQWANKCKKEGSKLLQRLLGACGFHTSLFKVYNENETLCITSYTGETVDLDVTVTKVDKTSPYEVIHNKDYAKKLKGRLRQEVVFCSTTGHYAENKNRFLLIHKDWETLSSGKKTGGYSWDSKTKEDALSIIDVCFTSSGKPLITLKPNHGKCPWRPVSYRGIDDMMSFEELKQLTGYQVTAKPKDGVVDHIVIDLSGRFYTLLQNSDNLEDMANKYIPQALAEYATARAPSYPKGVYLSIRKRLKQNKNKVILYNKDAIDTYSISALARQLTVMTQKVYVPVPTTKLKNEVYLKGEKYINTIDKLRKLCLWHHFYNKVQSSYKHLFSTYNLAVALDAILTFANDDSITNLINNLRRPSRATAMSIFHKYYTRAEVIKTLEKLGTTDRVFKYLGIERGEEVINYEF